MREEYLKGQRERESSDLVFVHWGQAFNEITESLESFQYICQLQNHISGMDVLTHATRLKCMPLHKTVYCLNVETETPLLR